MSEKVELKPCPFCGGQNIGFDSCKLLEECANFEECRLSEYHSIVCKCIKGGCGASSGYYLTVEDAIEAWNRRTRHDD